MTDHTVYVGNVWAACTEAILHALFSHCGTVVSVRLAGDPSFNNRYAFVEFSKPEEAQTAVLLNGLTLAERTMRVSMAKTAPSGGQQMQQQQQQLRGPSTTSYLGLGSAPATRGGKAQDPDRIMRTVHIGGIDPEVTEVHLLQYFSVCGPVVAVRISGDQSPRFAWVEFASREGCAAALSLDGNKLGNMNLKISASKSAIQTNGLTQVLQRPAMGGMMGGMGGGASPLMSMPSIPVTMPVPSQHPSDGPATVLVMGLSPETTDAEVLQFFATSCGNVRGLSVQTQPDGVRVAKVEFAAASSTDLATNLTGLVMHGKKLTISKASPASSGHLLAAPGEALPPPPPGPPPPNAMKAPAFGSHGSDHDGDLSRRRDDDRDRDRSRGRSRERERERDRDRGSRERERERSRERGRSHDRDRTRDKDDKPRERERERSRDRVDGDDHERRRRRSS